MEDNIRYDTQKSGITAASDIALCNRVTYVLQKHYPQYEWMVMADYRSTVGVVTIQLPFTMRADNSNWGWVLHIHDLETASDTAFNKMVYRAGGDILYRLGLPRGKAPLDAATRAMYHGLNKEDRVK